MKIIAHAGVGRIGDLRTIDTENNQEAKMRKLLDIVKVRVNSGSPHCNIHGAQNTLIFGYKYIRVVLDQTHSCITAEVYDNDNLVAIAEFEKI